MKMNRTGKIAVVLASLVLGGLLGAGCLWFSLRPATRAVASWLRHAPRSGETVEIVTRTDDEVIREHPVLRLARSPTGTVWSLMVMGKEVADSRERILPLLAKLAQYEPGLTVFIQADQGVDMASLEECLSEVTKQGFHSFLIQDILWGTTDLKTGGVP